MSLSKLWLFLHLRSQREAFPLIRAESGPLSFATLICSQIQLKDKSVNKNNCSEMLSLKKILMLIQLWQPADVNLNFFSSYFKYFPG